MQAHGDKVATAQALFGEVRCQLIGAEIQLAIGQLRIICYQRRRVRLLLHLLLKELRYGKLRRQQLLGAIPLLAHERALLGGEQGQLGDRLIHLLDGTLQQLDIILRQACHGAAIEQVTAVLDGSSQLIIGFKHGQSQIKLGTTGVDVQRTHFQAWNLPGISGHLAMNKQVLEEGGLACIPVRIELRYQCFEWHLVIRESIQRHIACALQQDAETWIPRQVEAHHQGVDKQPDHRFSLHQVTTAAGCSDQYILLLAVATQQQLPARQQ